MENTSIIYIVLVQCSLLVPQNIKIDQLKRVIVRNKNIMSYKYLKATLIRYT